MTEEEWVEMVRKCFHYDPKGFLVWVWHPNSSAMSRFVGKRFGSSGQDGYREGDFLRVRWKEHQLIWAFHHGKLVPRGMQIDHINRRRADNRITNLRLATHAQNHKNLNLRYNNDSGVRGVHKSLGRWCAMIMVDGHQIYLGRFDDIASARAARLRAEALYFGEFASDEAKALARRRF